MTYNKWLEIAAALDLNHAMIGEKGAKTDAEREECRRIVRRSQETLKKILKQNTR
ncbi:MAG: hypothetical protein IJC30_01840 [Alphaproteobacteria bacterium]|nr:hypothetical protein [Alphaproteobacteria bacterium]